MRRKISLAGIGLLAALLPACSVLNPWPKPPGWQECHKNQEGKCLNIMNAYEESLAQAEDGTSAAGPAAQPVKREGRNGSSNRPVYPLQGEKGKQATGPAQSPLSPIPANMPVRNPGKVIKVVIDPYVDDKGRWHSGEFVLIEVEKPQWLSW